MPFKNRVRLPFYVSRPQFPSERNLFPLADGSVKVQSVIVKKVYEGEVSYLPEKLHERLAIALAHDIVSIESDKYFGDVAIESEYEIDWQVFLDYPVAKAGFKARVTPFVATNSNCQTCQDATQLDLVDDTFATPVNEGETRTISVLDNDSIVCFPFTTSIVTFNPTYLVSAVIDAAGVITIVTKTPLPINNNVDLVTYRVTCPNGAWDEAHVFANINGSILACGEPSDISGNADHDSIDLTWTPPAAPPLDGYEWELYECSNMGTPVQSGATPGPSLSITGMTPATCYWFYVKSICDSVNQSAFLGAQWTTLPPPGAGTCGTYNLSWNDGSGDNTHFNNVTYLHCDGGYRTIPVFNGVGRPVCAMQHSAGNPVDIVGATSITYLGPC